MRKKSEYGSPKLFNTLYRLDLKLVNGSMLLQINQWNPYKEILYIKKNYEVTNDQLSMLRKSIRESLINKGHMWVKDNTLDGICSIFGWEKLEHFLGCEKCSCFRFVPMISFYTGCPVCNKHDQGSYTYFEAEEKNNQGKALSL